MSEQILKALMQLFAIIARPESNTEDRRIVVESFLKRQLNLDLVIEYLRIFDHYYSLYQDKQKDSEKKRRVISASSVKVLKICSEINEELTQQQKIIVLFQLFEFVTSDNNVISEQELEFISTVGETFHITSEDYNQIKEFTTYDQIPDNKHLLVIDNNKEFSHPTAKHICIDNLIGQLRILNVISNNLYLLRYLGQSEIYLNGQIIQQDKIYVFNTGASIRNRQIKSIYYSDIVSYFNEEIQKHKIVFEVKNVEFRFKNGALGLHDISFSEESGRLIGIMGSSGAGKSTLLNVLNGSNAPSKGEILINGFNIHTQKDNIEGIIGHVSQDDLLIEELTVWQNLYYNAKLCFDNFTDIQIAQTVERTLKNLGLYEIRELQVGSPLNKKISGGQRKRLNIALELIREPSVLFLDEPTSGLSSRDSENILDLLKELSLKGKLVFVVIHQPSSEIFKMFDRLIILDTGGFLIYNGDPIDSIIYFKSRIHHANWNESECHLCGNVNPEQIFNIVESRVLNEYGQETLNRKIVPKEWSMHYEESHKNEHPFTVNEYKELPPINFKIPSRINQFLVFVKRDILSKLVNTQYMVINFLEAPLLAFILSFIIRYYNVNVTNKYGYTFMDNSNVPVYIFMSVIIAIFMGLTVSAEEIIKDRKILKREAFLNLSWGSYLFSKISVQIIISAIQAFSFVMIGNTIIEIHGMYLHYWLILFSAWTASNLMGLVISDSFKTVVTIYILIPFLVIPQIMLSGILVKFEKLNPNISSPSEIPVYGEIITARWAYEALAVYQYLENDYQRPLNRFEHAMSIAEFKKNYWVLNLKNKINYVGLYYQDTNNKEAINDLIVIHNEINKEMEFLPEIPFTYLNQLYPNKLNDDVITETKNYLDKVNHYYIKLYNTANTLKDSYINDQQRTPALRDAFLDLKRKYYNDNLSEFVTNSNEVDRIVEYKGNLIQKIDPIFQNPEHTFIKAHFYAPSKRMFEFYIHTYWINLIIIWVMSIALFVVLYFRLFKRFLESFENLPFKKKK